MEKLYLVRHGITDRYAQSISQGWSNCPINQTGIAQTELLAKNIDETKIEHFFSSDLLRAQQTAEIINKKLKKQIIFDNRLREYNSGDLEGKKKHMLPVGLINEYKSNPHKFNAESHEDMYRRTQSFIESLRKGKIDNALLVTHRGFINMLRYCLIENKWDESRFLSMKPQKVAHSEMIELGTFPPV